MTKNIIAALLALSLTTPALAWGDREQGILTGIAGLLLLQNINKNSTVVTEPVSPVYQYPSPIPQAAHPGYRVVQPDYTPCQDLWDFRLRENCYRGAEARARQEYNRLLQESYRRGYQGR